ncbi:MAG: adenylate/guanylate cyclase domain-containing protein, partial [Myxococcota bacterium]
IAEHDANTDLHDLLRIMNEHAKTSDLSRRADQNPFTQTGMIGLHYNNLIFNLERSIEETDNLLSNVIPQPIAERLKHGEQIADAYDEVTVLFADLVGFTALTQRVVARRVVITLNDIFSAFDVIAAQHNVEKIKTTGDGYMAVAGVFHWTEDHAESCARMALEMHEAIKRYNHDNKLDLNLRVGINSGPVIAGVIGTSRFLYDMWGDTVNTASRMEAYGVPGKTQVTEMTFDLLKSRFDLEAREPIDVKGKGKGKGKGKMRNYFLLREKRSAGGS